MAGQDMWLGCQRMHPSPGSCDGKVLLGGVRLRQWVQTGTRATDSAGGTTALADGPDGRNLLSSSSMTGCRLPRTGMPGGTRARGLSLESSHVSEPATLRLVKPSDGISPTVSDLVLRGSPGLHPASWVTPCGRLPLPHLRDGLPLAWLPLWAASAFCALAAAIHPGR